MADPTSRVSAFSDYSIDKTRMEAVIKTSEALVIQGLTALNRSTGKSEFADDADDLIPQGLTISAWDGITDHLTGNGTYKTITRGGIILKNVSVTGVTAITDIGKLVYATDGQTLTLTRPTTGVPHGIVVGYVSTTYCDVYLFDLIDSIIFSLGGCQSGRKIKDLGTFPTNCLQSNTLQTLYTETSTEHYKIVSLHAQAVSYDAGLVAGAQSVNLAVDGVATSGGVLSLACTDVDAVTDMGVAINATAITALNEVHVGDVLTVSVAAGGTGFTADQHGAYKFYAVIEPLPAA